MVPCHPWAWVIYPHFELKKVSNCVSICMSQTAQGPDRQFGPFWRFSCHWGEVDHDHDHHHDHGHHHHHHRHRHRHHHHDYIYIATALKWVLWLWSWWTPHLLAAWGSCSMARKDDGSIWTSLVLRPGLTRHAFDGNWGSYTWGCISFSESVIIWLYYTVMKCYEPLGCTSK